MSSKSSSPKNTFNLRLMIFTLLSGVLAAISYGLFENPSQKDLFLSLWRADIEQLNSGKQLPKAWSNIKEIKFITGTDLRTKEWVQSIVPPIVTTPSGLYRLEIVLLSFPEDDSVGVFIQYDLIEIENNNIEWELARTYRLTVAHPTKDI